MLKQLLNCPHCHATRWINTISADNDIATLELNCLSCHTTEYVAAKFEMQVTEIVSVSSELRLA